jgi:BirA family biotin operon repressor/biotin-[acetyl-CoA-carboxylase] ligase
MLKEIETLYLVLKEEGFEPILDEWRRLSATLGRRVKALGQDRVVNGQAVDVDSAGALIIRTADGKTERVLAGDVTILR